MGGPHGEQVFEQAGWNRMEERASSRREARVALPRGSVVFLILKTKDKVWGSKRGTLIISLSYSESFFQTYVESFWTNIFLSPLSARHCHGRLGKLLCEPIFNIQLFWVIWPAPTAFA